MPPRLSGTGSKTRTKLAEAYAACRNAIESVIRLFTPNKDEEK